MDDALVALILITALGCELSAGALFAFSSFVVQALARLPDAHGMATTRSRRSIRMPPTGPSTGAAT
jgi:uncharacterized membrane protein